jgi:hypothetical protein
VVAVVAVAEVVEGQYLQWAAEVEAEELAEKHV